MSRMLGCDEPNVIQCVERYNKRNKYKKNPELILSKNEDIDVLSESEVQYLE